MNCFEYNYMGYGKKKMTIQKRKNIPEKARKSLVGIKIITFAAIFNNQTI